MSTANILKQLRISKNYSQTEVAQLLGIDRSTYTKYELGVSKPVRSLEKIAALYNVSTDFILDNENKDTKIILSSDEEKLIEAFRSLSLSYQNELFDYINYLVTKNQNSTPPPQKL